MMATFYQSYDMELFVASSYDTRGSHCSRLFCRLFCLSCLLNISMNSGLTEILKITDVIYNNNYNISRQADSVG